MAKPAIATRLRLLKDASEPWLKTLLLSKLRKARIFTFGYDAYVTDWRGVVS